MDREALFGWLTLKAVPGVGDILYKRLIERFGSPAAVFDASEAELLSVEGLGLQAAQAIRGRSASKEIEKELENLGGQGIRLLTLLDPEYPERLREIHDPPPVLYVRGEFRPEDRRAVAIVGSRNCSEYGRGMAHRLGRELAGRGFTIVSGLAWGIDAAAHEGALQAGGRAIGVTGCGADVCYPPDHEPLYDAVAQNGAVITEFPLGTPPEARNFPKRNRLISGTSLGVIVVEAGEKSGGLITAGFALEQGREVFAVPGSIHSRTSAGTHRLIKQGAKLVERVEDVLEELEGPLGPMTRPSSDASGRCFKLDPDEQKIYDILSADPQHIDDLTVRAGFLPSAMAGRLLQLELKGAIRHLAGHHYVRVESTEL